LFSKLQNYPLKETIGVQAIYIIHGQRHYMLIAKIKNNL